MKLRLEPQDDYMHPLEEAVNFNESMYFNLYDPAKRVGGFFRVGNRANEGFAEVTTCLYLPSGAVAFMYGRPEISNNDAFDAGGMKFEVIEPFKRLDVSYKGKVVYLTDPLQMADPRKAFSGNPWKDCEVKIAYSGVSPMYGGEPVGDDDTPLIEASKEDSFARGHYEQHIHGAGTIRVGDEQWRVDGHGLRDHSWGPRYWQAPYWYRWLTMNFGADAGMMLSIVTGRDGAQRIGGMVLENGKYTLVKSAKIRSGWTGAEHYHDTIHAEAVTEDGAKHEIEGRVLSLIPLRNRRKTDEGELLVTRISEGMTEYKWKGRTGYGLSEYLDQIVDGRPVGANEG